MNININDGNIVNDKMNHTSITESITSTVHSPPDKSMNVENRTSGIITMPDILQGRNMPLRTTTTTDIDTNPVLSDITVPTNLDNLDMGSVFDDGNKNSNEKNNNDKSVGSYNASTSDSKVSSNIFTDEICGDKINDTQNISTSSTIQNDLQSMNETTIEQVDQPQIPSSTSSLSVTRSNDISSVQFRDVQLGQQNRQNTSKSLLARSNISKSQTPSISDSPSTVNSRHRFPIARNSTKMNRSSTYASKSTVKAIPIRNPKNQRLLDYEDKHSTRSISSSMTTSLSMSFLFGFYHNEKNKKHYKQKQLISKEYWMKDESAKECFTCGKPFSTFRRKHHCRICGQIFCHSCTLLMDGERLGYDGKMRVCHNCFEHVNTYEDSSDEEDGADETTIDNENYLKDSNSTPHRDNRHRGNTSGSSLAISSDSSSPNEIHLNDGENMSHLSLSDSIDRRQKEIILLNKDDVRSIITADEDSKLFLMTPPPPPKMAIPAKKKGESLEIAFDSNLNDNNNINHNLSNSGYSHTNERYSIRDVDMLPIQQRHKHKKHQYPGSTNKIYSNSPSEGQHRRIPSMNSLRKSLLRYVGSTNTPLNTINSQSVNDSINNSESRIEALQNTNNVIGNLTNKNFKFQFNFTKDPNKEDHLLDKESTNSGELYSNTAQDNSIDEENCLEDEGTMSIYSSLHENSKTSNPIRSTRNSSRSFQRAQASLNRIQNRRIKNRSKTLSYKDIDQLTNSAPNLLSVVSDDDSESNYMKYNTFQHKLQDRKSYFDGTSLELSQPLGQSEILRTTNHSKSDTSSSPWRKASNIAALHHRRTSTMNGSKKNQLNEVAALHMSLLLKQVIADQDIQGVERWENMFKENLLKKVQNTTLSVRDSNTLDYRQKYVKIKRIAGGTIEQSEYVNGIVFSKALPSKLMPTHISNPRILLIMFPLEYQKNDKYFLSLETVFAQEREYLNKLVTRLTSLHPDIIFVGANVSGYALELLLKAGVTVQFNLKPQIIERIARLTEADIAVSIDKLASNVKMGECGSFEVKSYIYGNVSNTYTFLRGCNLDFGGTILLRGDTSENLEKIKHVAEFMVYTVFSLELESSFFNDNFIQLSSSFYLEKSKAKRMAIFEGYFADFLEKFSHRILTTSPTVELSIPFLLTKVRELELQIKEKQEYNDSFEDKDISADSPEIKRLGIESTLTFKDMRYITSFLRQKKIEDLQTKFQRRCKQWEVLYSSTHNMLGTGSHQSITVLYSMVSTKTATPCIGPQLVNIDYFWDTDISIGQLIENIVSTAYYPCEQGCNSHLFDHYRSYVHGTGKVDILIEKLQTKLPRLKNIILTWSYCKNCGTSTPILQISEKTWNYSFGKYLEIMFWSKKGSLSDIGNCTHDFTKDHVKYFSYGDLVIRMEYSDLEIHEVNTPPVRTRWQPSIDTKFKVENYYKILDRINTFYESVINRLGHVKIDSINSNKQEDAQNTINALKEKVYKEKKILFTDLEKLYQKYPGDQHLQLNRLVKVVCDYAATWDNDFNNFEKEYLPSETDITRITSKQLKKLFKETKPIVEDSEDTSNYVPSSLNASPDSITVPSDDQTPESVSSSAYSECIIGSDKKQHLKPDDSALTLDFEETMPEQTDKIEGNKFHELSNDSVITKNTSKSNSKVTELATFFDQIHLDALSRDSELQKEFKRLRGNKNKNKSYKLQSSAPIIEVYKNVKDAVAEPLHNAENFENKRVPSTDSKKGIDVLDNNKIIEKETTTKLENELENSITRWGENIWNNDTMITKETTPEEETKKTDATELGTNEIKSIKRDDVETQPEQSLLMKAITNFWADRSGYLWKPLVYPISPTDHVFADNDVIIREDEPSSLAAFCLNMVDYKERILNVYKTYAHIVNSTHMTENASVVISEIGTNAIDDQTSNPQLISDSNIPVSDAFDNSEVLEKIMTKKTAVHLRYQFEDDSTVMSCKIFFSEHFDAFRKISNCKNNFIQSLSRCIKWDSSGGKSGSLFLKTLDERFVIKELSHPELDAFIKFAPSYFEYMAQAIFHDLPTALAKIFGFYQIQVKNPNSSNSYKLDVIIMENLFYDNKPSRIFDLKGSMRNRHVEQTGKENEVLLDENMVEYIYESPIHVREYDKKLLRASLWNDTLFLARMNVMDYSLVVGINNENLVLTVGIIDFIRTFTWDKKLESWVKEKSLAAGGNKVIKQPTVVTPRQYKNRFREAMERYILMVPDPWYQEYT